MGWISAGGALLSPSLGQAGLLDRHSRITLHVVFWVVGNLLRLKPSSEWKVSRLEPKRIWRKFRRRHNPQDPPEYRFLRRVSLRAWQAQWHDYRLSAYHHRRALVILVLGCTEPAPCETLFGILAVT